jgi:hypothetical protein
MLAGADALGPGVVLALGAVLVPDGTGPDGTGPDGTVPDGTVPDGTGPDGTVPDGTGPDAGALTCGAVGPGVDPAGVLAGVVAGTGRPAGAPATGLLAVGTTGRDRGPGDDRRTSAAGRMSVLFRHRRGSRRTVGAGSGPAAVGTGVAVARGSAGGADAAAGAGGATPAGGALGDALLEDGVPEADALAARVLEVTAGVLELGVLEAGVLAAGAGAGAPERVVAGSRRRTVGLASPAWRTTTLLDAHARRRTVPADHAGIGVVAGAGVAAEISPGPTGWTGVAARSPDGIGAGVGSVPAGRCRTAVGKVGDGALVRAVPGAAAVVPGEPLAVCGDDAPGALGSLGAALGALGAPAGGVDDAGERRTRPSKRGRWARSCHGARIARRIAGAVGAVGADDAGGGLSTVPAAEMVEEPPLGGAGTRADDAGGGLPTVPAVEEVEEPPLAGAVADAAGGRPAGSPGAEEPPALDWRGARAEDRRTVGGRDVGAGAAVRAAAAAAATWGAGGAPRPARLALSLAWSLPVNICPTAATSSIRRTAIASPRSPPTMPPGVYDVSSGTARAARGSPRSGSRRIATGRAGASHAGGAAAGDEAAAAPLPAALLSAALLSAALLSAAGRGVHHRGGAELPARPRGSGPISARRMSTGREVDAAKRLTDEARLPIRLGNG